MTGTVTKYISKKGYGFIGGEDGESYFFHISDTDLDPGKRYVLEDLNVEFSPHQLIEKNIIRNYAKEILFRLDGDD